MEYRVLALGDVASETGLTLLEKKLRAFKREQRIDFTVVNGENISGTGLTRVQAEELLAAVARFANGDARTALNALELAVTTTRPDPDGVVYISKETAQDSIQQRMLNMDEEHYYNMLSAFCKSLRGGDADAALAWFARLMYAGVDPRIIARRVIVHASEDVGLANPQALVQAVSAAQALEMIGMPEARLNLAQAIIYVC